MSDVPDHPHPLDADNELWTRLYVESLKWIHDMVTATWTKAAEGGTAVEMIEVMADYMDGRDAVDDESIALFLRAKEALVATVEARDTRIDALRHLAAELAQGNRPHDGHWYSPDKNGDPHYLNGPLTPAEATEWAEVQRIIGEVG